MQTQPEELTQKPAPTSQKRCLLGPVAFVFSASHTGSWRVERPVFNGEKCTSCALCAKFCPAGLVTVDKGNHFVTFELTYCKGCGVCMSACALNCISMVPEKDLV